MELADNQCIPCRGGVPPLGKERIDLLLEELGGDWEVNAAGHLQRAYAFRNFARALQFANEVCAIAEEQAHHPDLLVRWGQCTVEIWTQKIGGLTDSDFYFAAKVRRLHAESSGD
jgi:4a-hydroxytetrahydrobiopterin dehydratase